MRYVVSLSHTHEQRKQRIVFILKYCRKAVFGRIRWELGGVLRWLANQEQTVKEDERRMPDYRSVVIPNAQ